jgi:NADPH:quinone reductase
MTQTMRAMVAEQAGGPEVLKMKQLPIPQPGPGQARIRVAYAALNPLDTHSRGARVKWMAPAFPYVPGYEYAGRVDAVGEGVDKSLVGKRVSAQGEWGGNAEFALATAAKLTPVPEGFDWKLAASFATTGPTAWHMVHSVARVKAGDKVVVHSAAGAVGALTVQIAKSVGATVFGLVGSAERVAYAKQFGADHLIDRVATNWADEVLKLTNNAGVQAIFDGVAGPEAPLNYKAIAPLGNVVYLGQMAGPPPEVNISMLIGKSFSVTGFVQYFHQAATKGAENAELFRNMQNGTWRLPIERIATMEEIPEMHRLFEARALKGRTLITIGGEI